MTLIGESSLEGKGQGAIVRQLPVISSVSQHENQGFPLFLPRGDPGWELLIE